jgi:rare lipoprotein A
VNNTELDALSQKFGGSMRYHQLLIISLPITIGGCSLSATPAESPSLPTLPMPAVYAPLPPTKPTVDEVTASWYGSEFAGRSTTSGERFDPRRLTAASITLPLGSVVKVENPKNGRSLRVRINDCGPFAGGRSLDLSLRAAQKIGITHNGLAHVRVTTIKTPSHAELRCSP